MTHKIPLSTLMAGAMAIGLPGCGDDDNGAQDAGTGGDETTAADTTGAVVPPDPAATFLLPQDIPFMEILPGVAQMGPAHGDPTAGAHGTFLQIVAGGEVPPHFYTGALHAIAVAGTVENPTPTNQTDPFQLTLGAYNFVPAAAEHSTRCIGADPCTFYVHQDQAFDFNPVDPPMGDPVPQNPDAVFTAMADATFDEILPGAVAMATVAGDRTAGAHGTLLRITAGAEVPPHFYTLALQAVVLAGTVENPIPSNQTEPLSLPPGSFLGVPAAADHITRCTSSDDCVLYVHQDGAFDFNPTE